MDEEPRIDPVAWVDRYGDLLFRFALQRVGDPSAAEDLVQETFLAALRAKERFQGRSSEKTWLFGILKHKIVDHYRRQRNRSGMDVEAMAEDAGEFFHADGKWRLPPAHWDVNPQAAFEQKQFVDAFYRCLAEMSPRMAEAFAYREIEGLDTEEICKAMQITPTNCWVILYRARMALRKCLEANWLAPADRGQVR